jgi:hypothetical protein
VSDAIELGSEMEMKPAGEVVVIDRRGTLANYVDQEPRAVPEFAGGVTRHHKPSYEDYNLAKMHIMEMLGDINDEEGLILFGHQVCVAVFVKPIVNLKGIILSDKEQKEDFWQQKVGMVVSVAPGAFTGKAEYLEGRYGNRGVPKVGDWVFMNASSGIQMFLRGTNAKRPKGVDTLGREYDLFNFDGWPVRICDDESLIGRIGKPHSII